MLERMLAGMGVSPQQITATADTIAKNVQAMNDNTAAIGSRLESMDQVLAHIVGELACIRAENAQLRADLAARGGADNS